MSRARGQATIPVLALAALAAAGALALLALVALAGERARAQTAADGAALSAALTLGRSADENAAALAARAYAARTGVEVVRAEFAGGAVEVEVRRPTRLLHVPALLGGGIVEVAPSAVARAAAGAVPGALPADVPAEYAAAIAAAAAAEGIPIAILAAQLRAESGFDPRAISPAGAQGIAQFMPATWNGDWNPWRARSPFDPEAAIAAQARYLRRLLDAASGDVARALAFYNAGQGGAAGPPSSWPAETRAYVARILDSAGGDSSGPAMAGSGARLIGRRRRSPGHDPPPVP